MTLTVQRPIIVIAVKPSQMAEIAKAIAAAVGVAGATSTYTENAAWIAAMAKDLLAHQGQFARRCRRQSAAGRSRTCSRDERALGNVGQTVVYAEPMSRRSDKTQIEQLRELIADIDAGASRCSSSSAAIRFTTRRPILS